MHRGGVKRKALSGPMAAALQLAREHGNILVRFEGGYWSYDGAACSWGVPLQWFSTSIIAALVRRGDMQYGKRHQGLNFEAMISDAEIERHERRQAQSHRSEAAVDMGDDSRQAR